MKKIFVSAVVALLLLMIITSIGLASFPRTEASGTFITASTTINSVTEDKFNTMIDLNSTVTYTGTLEGTSTLQGTLTIHHDESGSFQGVETFTGLVNGIPGTLTFKLEGSSDLYQAIHINNIITSGTGELVGLQGELTKAGIIKDDGPIGTYTGRISNQ
jgi:Protein of unknown function (DUF3224)